ncbi:galactose-specific lectin nattectin-like [Silurus meridionalis]|nr:galactose-specific lectin nattectin-like [Silurus meridionalis]
MTSAMLFILLISGLTTLSFGQSDLRCQRYWSQFGSRCFRIFTTETSWNDAEQNCVNMGGHLASVHNKEEYAFIQGLILKITLSNKLTWIGANKIDTVSIWFWSDGSTFDYTFWSPGQPDNLMVENCLQMNYGGCWNNAPCSYLYSSICAKAAVPAIIRLVIQLKIVSDNKLLQSDSEELIQKVKQRLIDSGMPSKSTLRLKRLYKKPG